MRQQISPWVAVGVILAVAAIAFLVIYQRTGPGANAKLAEDVIKSSVVGGGQAPAAPGTRGSTGVQGTRGSGATPFIGGPPPPGAGQQGVIGGAPR